MPPAPAIATVAGAGADPYRFREGSRINPHLPHPHLTPCPRCRLPELSPPSPEAAAAPVHLPVLGWLRRAEARRASRSRRGSCRCLPLRQSPSFQSFQNLGLDCANWTEPIYADLVRKASGDEERMVVLFFDRIGWPTSLPTSEKGSFTKSVLREKLKALEKLSSSDALPLRPGVEKFIDDALKEGVPVAILATYGRNGEKISRSIVEKLGPERTSKINIIGTEEVERSFYGQLVLGEGVASSLDEQLTKEAQKAEEVASLLKLSVDINTASKSSEKIIATLRAGSEYVGCDVQSCILVSGSQPSVIAAERIGMPCIVVRSRLIKDAQNSYKNCEDGSIQGKRREKSGRGGKRNCTWSPCSAAPLCSDLLPKSILVARAFSGGRGSHGRRRVVGDVNVSSITDRHWSPATEALLANCQEASRGAEGGG